MLTGNKPGRPGGALFVKICLGLIALFLVLIVIVMIAGRNSNSSDSSEQQAQETRQQARIRSTIEGVLQQDAVTGAGTSSVAQIVDRMRAIDTSGCPNDFRVAYVTYIHAGEAMVDVEQRAIQFEKDSNSTGAYVEAFIRGVMMDPFGKAKEEMQTQNQLQRDAAAAAQQIRQSHNQVEEIAVSYGANLPKR
jgi:hypothetical protein